ncbi:hypothetical protein CPT32_07940 [Rhizobium sophoriradicis]|nr:hypothetical protein [Rhizobium sophoriradicis]PCK87520.1 hypothetical protein CPT32_07940 [Rhizobium sophoriradicis]
MKIPFAIFNTYEQRVADRMSYARSLLKQGFDFNLKEDYAVLREKAPWPQSGDRIVTRIRLPSFGAFAIWRQRTGSSIDFPPVLLLGQVLLRHRERSTQTLWERRSRGVLSHWVDQHQIQV